MQRRLTERMREIEMDEKDRNKELEELEELKTKVFSGEFDNPKLEFERVRNFFNKLFFIPSNLTKKTYFLISVKERT